MKLYALQTTSDNRQPAVCQSLMWGGGVNPLFSSYYRFFSPAPVFRVHRHSKPANQSLYFYYHPAAQPLADVSLPTYARTPLCPAGASLTAPPRFQTRDTLQAPHYHRWRKSPDLRPERLMPSKKH